MAIIFVIEDLAGPASLGRGGLTMYVLQWLHGIKRLGHHVIFLEFLKDDPGNGREAATRFFGATMTEWWHADRSALLLEKTRESLFGLHADQVAELAKHAAAVVLLAAHYRRDPYPLVDKVRPRILIEQDPGYTQLWAVGGAPADVYGEQDLYFTVGGNIGTPRCSVPTLGIPWRATRNPVILDWWSRDRMVTRDRFTTIADWRSYGYLEFEGDTLGPKAEEFRKFIKLPELVGEGIEIALNIDPDDPDLALLRAHGWCIQSPEVVATPGQYREYVAGSCGEFSCVKGGYARTRGGWFSDRSACYLAAGRPVILQATGFEDLLPTGRGLFAVKTVEEAAAAIQVVRRDYARHSAWARDLAREHFDSGRVVRRVLHEAGL